MRRQIRIFFSLVAADLLGLSMAVVLGVTFRQLVLPHLSNIFQTDPAWRVEYLWLLVIGVGVFAYDGLYWRRHTAWEELRHLLRSVSIALILFLAVMTIMKRGADVSRPALIIAWIAAPGILVGLRIWVKRHLLARSSFWPRRILVAGAGAEAARVASHLKHFPELGYELVGYLGSEATAPGMPGTHYGALDDLESVVASQRIDELIIALPGESRITQFDLLKRAEGLVPRVSVLPELFDADKLNVDVEKVERYFFLSFQNNLMKRSNRYLKSAFEILTILVTVPFWGGMLLALSVATKVTSPGPVFFRQKRIGAGGGDFWCYKFRTMVIDADERLSRYLAENPAAQREWLAERKLKDDPRITPIGRILRKTSLDELPQMLNVLMGEMSLVGPRPIVVDEIEKYGDYFSYYKAVCPGISGLWQVSGRNDIDYQQRVMLDTFYVRNWSLWLDFMILLKTIPAVLKKDGAY
ncbi:undecaprenyl-phosphate galactose phosphotransferase WbaP [Desulfuromonas versatilis]|uniref:Undecaprenyl-phosphate galactose phosphotransferase WbaP n=1 Tax=Desulfuromonas versatilis TaxID=2802975 RepID=A0ABM8HVU3_9BACT|nr:sugar transferase [Desulfuromonas versatilis]BCR04676.1 undecaprenyl-phosphate galactose phosphotransferase WbaP [Desulfuromonas versatilis]